MRRMHTIHRIVFFYSAMVAWSYIFACGKATGRPVPSMIYRLAWSYVLACGKAAAWLTLSHLSFPAFAQEPLLLRHEPNDCNGTNLRSSLR